MDVTTLYFVPMIITFIYGVIIAIVSDEEGKDIGFNIMICGFIPIINILAFFFLVGMTIFSIVYLIVKCVTHEKN